MPDQTEPTTHLQPIITWKAPEYERHEKGKLWFMIAAVLIIMVIVYFILTDAATAAVAFILLAGLYFLAHQSGVKEITIEINELGIKTGEKKFYLYSHIQSFWIIYTPPHNTTLHLLTSGRLGKDIIIQLGIQDPAPVRNYLKQQIPEVEGKKENFWDILARVLKI